MASFDGKPSPEEVLERLLEGNKRFAEGNSRHPNSDISRRQLASTSSQAKYAIATVLTCSDSRVPPELIFDCGIMDIFVVRLAGNVISECTLGSIEYGVLHVNTPLLLVLAHSQCGAITGVVDQVLQRLSTNEPQRSHPIEPNIQKLLDILYPPVEYTCKCHPEIAKSDLINLSAKNHAGYVVQEILKRSSGISELQRKGIVKVIPAFYELETGLVSLI